MRSTKRKQRQRSQIQSPNKTASLAEALLMHQAGQSAEAKEMYCRLLESDPRNADGWHLLGMLMHQNGENHTAIECVQNAIGLRHDVPDYYSNLGVVYRALGDSVEAIKNLQQAIQLKPDYLDAWNNLGVVWLENTRWNDAEDCFRQVLDQDPKHVLALTNLGNALNQQRQVPEAISCYEEVIRLSPNHLEAYTNLATVLQSIGQLDEAAALYSKVLILMPESVEAHNNLGNIHKAFGRFDEAMANFEAALSLKPDLAATHNNYGHLFKVEGRLEEATARFRRAIEIDPVYTLAHVNLGSTLFAQCILDESLDSYREALRIDPDYSEARSNYLFYLSSAAETAPQQLFDEHVKWGELHGTMPQIESAHANLPDPNRRLRIGYVSPDLKSHAVARYLEPTLKEHNADNVEVVAYAEVLVPDEVTTRLQKLTHEWRSTVGMSDLQVAQQILDDKIDILVDLAGHTANNRLKVFAYKPAPVQVTWLGYPNTTGLKTIDYRLTSAIQDPPNETSYHTEELVRLPSGTTCFTPPRNAPPVADLPVLRSGHITFGSLHRLEKLSEGVFDLWSQVLKSVPDSRLLVFWPSLHGETKSRIEKQFTSRGIDVDRIELRHEPDERGYLGIYDDIDIGLDVFPWTGGTTTREALWMGVVVLALYGDRRTARGTAAVMDHVGLQELIADSHDRYVELAMQLASDLDKLKQLRAGMRDRMRDTICNAPRFTGELEDAYRAMWVEWCRNAATGEETSE